MLGCEVIMPGSALPMKVCVLSHLLNVGRVSNMTCFLCVSYKGVASTHACSGRRRLFAQLKIITHLRCIENQLLVATGTTLNGAVLTSFLMVCLARVGKMSGMAVEKNAFQPSCVTRHSSFQCSIDSLPLITMVSADSVDSDAIH